MSVLRKNLCLSAVLLFLSATAAHAIGYSGYHYPAIGACSPACDGVRVTYIEPDPIYAGSNGEGQDGSSLWIGIAGLSAHTASGCASQLLQFGTQPTILSTGAKSHQEWYEYFPCINVTNFGSMVISSGDTVTLELLCTVNCTSGGLAQQWTMTWTNVTTGLSQSRTQTFTASQTVWMEGVDIVIEPQSFAIDSTVYQPVDYAPAKFFNGQIHQGGVWIPLPLNPAAAHVIPEGGFAHVKTSPSTYHLDNASPIIDPLSGAFYICGVTVQQATAAQKPCPASSYSGTAGFGP